MKAIALIIPILLLSCATCSPENRLATYDLKCEKITSDNAMPCCMQFMFGGENVTGKAALCGKIVEETAKDLAQKRRNAVFKVCFKEKATTIAQLKTNQACFDKIGGVN